MKCNTEDMFIWYTRVAKNSIKEDEHVHKLFYTNQSYKHLSEAERGEIEAYLSVGLKPAEIARRLGRNRSTITREINRGSITQLKKVNGQKVYYQHYYADAAHNRYRDARETKGA